MTSSQDRPPVPFDLAVIESMPDWRRNLAWPLSHKERRAALKAQMQALIGFICGASDNVRGVLSLAGQFLTHNAKVLADTALALSYAEKHGLRFCGDRPELAYLRGDITTPEQSARSWNLPLVGAGPRWARRIARVASWTPWWRLPGACFFPSAVAASHNSLLRTAAAMSPKAVGFRHADTWLEAARAAAGDVPPGEGLDDLAASLAETLSAVGGLEEPWRGRLRSLIEHHAQQVLPVAERDLTALRGYDGLPGELWAGTGGYYPDRALSLEVLRRGGTVCRFDHGGPTGFTEDKEAIALSEFLVSTEYVVATPEMAKMFAETGAGRLIESSHKVEISGLCGDPTFCAPQRRRHTSSATRRSVVYVPTTLIGFRQLYPPLLPDIILLDWQLRLASIIASLPVELICRPHPEGLHPGDHHPLEEVAPLGGGPFEQVMARADLFIFDYPLSSTFWQCLCTDVPVVLLDMGMDEFTPTARPFIERRCRVVPVTYDEHNLPQVDSEALADAVVGGGKTADPSEFRRLLAGEGQHNGMQ